MSTYAYMIRRDGKVFDVDFHPYGTEGVEYVLDYMPWLFECTSKNSTREDIAKLASAVASYSGESIEELFEGSDVSSNFLRYISSYSYDGNESPNVLVQNVEDDLNQEFCRARLGGRYNSDDVVGGEIVFRISSDGFNWFNRLWEFVYNNKSKIKYVTIVRDLESTGEETPYKEGRDTFFRMPVDQFITLSGNPVIQNLIK